MAALIYWWGGEIKSPRELNRNPANRHHSLTGKLVGRTEGEITVVFDRQGDNLHLKTRGYHLRVTAKTDLASQFP